MQKGHRTLLSLNLPACARALVLCVCLFFATFSFVAHPAHAQIEQGQKNVQDTAVAAGFGANTDLQSIIGRIIYIFLGFLGVLLLGYLLYGGYLYMTASGDAKKVESAQAVIRNAVIGVLIIAASFAITAYILKSLGDAIGGGIQGKKAPGLPPGIVGGVGALGNGIEYHIPGVDAVNVPRNSPIIITFAEAMNPASLIAGWTPDATTTKALNADNIQIYRTVDGISKALKSNEAKVTYTYDKRTFVIKPEKLLGSPTEKMKYTVHINGGNNGVQLEKGGAALPVGKFKNGYTWTFEVSTTLDLTPPKVIAVVPPAIGGPYPRNVVVQINFDEAVDPTAASGLFDGKSGFTNITVFADQTPLAGEYKIANQYKTVEFLTNDKCGTNTCGKDIFCLPKEANIKVITKAATLSDKPPQAKFTDNGYDGITDVVGNSLDGNANDTAEGPDIDNHASDFATTGDLKITPPVVQSTTPDSWPGQGQSNRPVDETVKATFDSLLQASTITSKAAKIEAKGWKEKDPDTFWYFVGLTLLNEKDEPVKPNETPKKGQVTIQHRVYIPSGGGANELNYYNPFLYSDIQDAYQNCFYPSAYVNGNKKCDATANAQNCCNNSPQNAECVFNN